MNNERGLLNIEIVSCTNAASLLERLRDQQDGYFRPPKAW
jgi:hypothetical protein